MAESEASIATTRKVDVDALMSDGFSVEEYLGAEKSVGLNLASQHVDKNELESDIKMGAYLESIGVSGDDNMSANMTAARAVLNQTTSQGTWGAVKEGWKNNQIQLQIADLGLAGIYNRMTPEQVLAQYEVLNKGVKETKAKGFASFAKDAANMGPMMIETSGEGAKVGLAVGGAAAAFTAAAQTATVASIPSEVVTVPGAFLVGAGAGMTAGAVKRATEIEAGLMYIELLTMTDENGNKLDSSITKPIAATVGVINGMLELAQIKDIIKTIPGGKKLLQKAQRDTIRNLVKNKSVMSVLAKATGRYAGHVGFETTTEVLQEADNVIFDELAKNISNQLVSTNMPGADIGQITNRLIDTARESAKGFSLIAGPGSLVQTMSDLTETTPEKPKAGVVEPVSRISRTMPAEAVIPRIDISQMGRVMVDIPPEMPAKKPRQPRVAGPPVLTPEQEFTLQQTEATLEASEPFTVKPRLYIGNVTERMKNKFADIAGMEPEDVRAFLDGAFPTKRTGIELTTGEARTLLVHMEASLQERLDQNQINTHSDMARANADWGDIKALRKSLGLPEAQRPFKIIRDQGTEVITIENIKERISKAVQPSKLARIDISHVDRLNAVLRRAAKYAKEGFAAGKKEQKQIFAELKYLRKQAEMREKMIDKIAAPVPDSIDFFYREAIQGIQNQLDFDVRKADSKAKRKKESLKAFLNRNPDRAADIPQALLDTLEKKDVSDLSHTDLLNISSEVNRLKEIGRLKSEEFRRLQQEARDNEAVEMVKSIDAAPGNLFPSVERANSLRPLRIFDMLDGGKEFAGRIANFFYRQTNEDYNTELQNTDTRHNALKQRLAELGLTFNHLGTKRTIGDIKLTLDEMLSVYAGWKNAASQAALKYGGVAQIINGKEKFVEVTDQIYNQIEAALTETEKVWADTIIQEYAQNYNRLRNSVIRAENRDMGHEENYTPIRRMGLDFENEEQEILNELALRHFFSQVGPHKGFTIPRKNIPPEYQKPMELGLTKQWVQQVRKQEHYINNAEHLKEMRVISKNEQFKAAVVEKFGAPVYSAIDAYINRIANPDFYKSFSDIEQASKLLRRHTAIAYIGFNISSYLNQVPSISVYWANSSVSDIIVASLDSIFHPMQTFNAALAMHPQLAHTMIEREMAELERADENSYKKIINTIGKTGMYGIFAIDRATRVIGMNAVYNKGIRDGLSPSEAAHKASMATLLMQESSAPKDVAKIYGTNEFLNWMTMFTNQLNQIYNITTYDIPVAFRNGKYREAARSSMALSIMALAIWSISNGGDLPDEPEDAAAALSEQAIGSIPLVGGTITAGFQGWEGSVPPPIRGAAAIGKTGRALYDGDYQKAMKKMAEPLSIVTGFPYQGVSEIYKEIEE